MSLCVCADTFIEMQVQMQIHIHLDRYSYLCMYVCMYVCMSACMHIYIYTHKCLYVYVYVYVCIHIFMIAFAANPPPPPPELLPEVWVDGACPLSVWTCSETQGLGFTGLALRFLLRRFKPQVFRSLLEIREFLPPELRDVDTANVGI